VELSGHARTDENLSAGGIERHEKGWTLDEPDIHRGKQRPGAGYRFLVEPSIEAQIGG
jgi:hypothetical protein